MQALVEAIFGLMIAYTAALLLVAGALGVLYPVRWVIGRLRGY